MTLRTKATAFGINFHIDLETSFFDKQKRYNRLLEHFWSEYEPTDEQSSKAFITQALNHLPLDFFIIFDFESSTDAFVQLCNTDDNIILDAPFWITNSHYGKESQLIAGLRSLNFKRSYKKHDNPVSKPYTYFYEEQGKDKKSIRINFNKDTVAAADVALLIAQLVFEIPDPRIISFQTNELEPAK